MEETKDFFGNKLSIGDTVAFMEIKYRSLMIGKIVSITEKTVLIEHEGLRDKNVKSQTRQFYNQVIKKL
jgi:predicted metal-dependent hydrolase